MAELPPWQTAIRDLIDTDPAEAIRRVKALRAQVDGQESAINDFRAAVLIDAGGELQDVEAIGEGVEILRDLIARDPAEYRHYHLANGYASLVASVEFRDASWWLTTSENRRAARAGYRRALAADSTELCARAWTNLGNQLIQSHRWVEAYDAYREALGLEPAHGIAASGAAKVLLRAISLGLGDADVLGSIARQHLEVVRQHPDRIRELAGVHAERELADLLRLDLPEAPLGRQEVEDRYLKFVASNRLALSLTIEGLDPDLPKWDTLNLPGIIEPVGGAWGAPPVFAAFNAMKADYLAARFLAFLALSGSLPESGNYVDTLDYANYGVRSAGLAMAQRAVVDLLDKIAVAVCEHLTIEMSPRKIYFRTLWRIPQDGQPGGAWRSGFEQEAAVPNSGLIALADLAEDLDDKGALVDHRLLRDAATHRFIILHDLGGRPDRESSFVEHVDQRVFEMTLIQSLRMGRAALVYFVDLVRQHASRQAPESGLLGQLFLPDHDWVRGRSPDNYEEEI